MRLAAYLRTSTSNGAGDSLDAQEEACRSWAEVEGHEVEDVFRDAGVSGGLPVDERPGLAAALVQVEEQEVDGLVVHRIDRLARELHIQEAALARAWSAGEHVRVFEAVEGEIPRDDPADPQRTFLRQVMGAAAQLEKGMIRARLAGGRRRKAARGGYVGGRRLHRRYGYRLVEGQDGKCHYQPVPEEQRAIRRMRTLRAKGRTLRAIGTALERAGIPGPGGKGWSPPTIYRILKRESHADTSPHQS
jgi:DNA invertase Pin-like site-specific DNA recombinase